MFPACCKSLPLAAACAMLATACAGSEPLLAPAELRNAYLGAQPLYAVLERRADGEWTFSTISAEAAPSDSGYVVRLNDLSPAFDVRLAECEARPYRETDRCSPLNPFRQKNVGVLDKIVSGGLSATTGGKLTGINASYNTEFDEAAFNSAVDEALLDTGLDENRAVLIDRLEQYEAQAKAYRARLDKVWKDYSRQYEQEARTSVKLEPEIAGLREYYTADLPFDELVSIETNELAESTRVSAPAIPPVLPCPAADCMADLAAARETLDEQQAAALAGLESGLRQHTASYRVQCPKREYAGYHFELRCPEQIERSDSGMQVLPLTIIIHARDFEQLFPEFHAGDEQLAADTDGNMLILRNLTGDFVEIRSVSLYYNSQINTVSNLSNEPDLAPYATVRYPLTRFSSTAIDTEAFHARMTPDKASRAQLSFGLAVKYSVRDRDVLATLYGQQTYNVECVIENRLRPGTCTPESKMAAGESDPPGNEPAAQPANTEQPVQIPEGA